MGKESRHSQLKKTGARQDLLTQRETLLKQVQALEEGEDYEAALGSTPAHRFPPMKGVLLVALLILLVAIPVWMSIGGRDGKSPDGDGEAGVERGRVETEPLPEVDESAVTNLSEEGVARAFLAARSWEERRHYVREADEVIAHLDRFREEVKAFPIEIANLKSMGAITPGGVLRYERFAVRMKSGGMRFLCTVQTEKGPRVDYDAFARYGTASWQKLLDGQPGSEVRLMAAGESYYNHRFSDEAKWACFKLTSPDWPKTAWGYAPSGSVTAQLLAQIVARQLQRVTLALRAEGDSAKHSQFVIERVVINGWVRTPLDPEEMLRMKMRK